MGVTVAVTFTLTCSMHIGQWVSGLCRLTVVWVASRFLVLLCSLAVPDLGSFLRVTRTCSTYDHAYDHALIMDSMHTYSTTAIQVYWLMKETMSASTRAVEAKPALCHIARVLPERVSLAAHSSHFPVPLI